MPRTDYLSLIQSLPPEPTATPVWKTALADGKTLLLAAGVMLGLALLAVSLVWPRLATGRGAWSDTQATAYAEAARTFHGLSMRGTALGQEARLESAQRKYDQLRAQLEDARGQATRWAGRLRWGGTLLAGASLAGLVIRHRRSTA